MATLPELLPEATRRVKAPRPLAKDASRTGRFRDRRLKAVSGAAPVLLPWLRAQSINVTRHAAALRPFKREEFANGAAAPSEGHIQVVNQLITKLRRGLLKMSRRVHDKIAVASEKPSPPKLRRVVASKDKAHRWVQGIEKIWDFYFELFGQRQGKYGDWLLSCDRIAMDCYQAAYRGWRCAVCSRTAALLLHEDRICAGYHSAGHPHEANRQADEPVSAGAVALPPAG